MYRANVSLSVMARCKAIARYEMAVSLFKSADDEKEEASFFKSADDEQEEASLFKSADDDDANVDDDDGVDINDDEVKEAAEFHTRKKIIHADCQIFGRTLSSSLGVPKGSRVSGNESIRGSNCNNWQVRTNK